MTIAGDTADGFEAVRDAFEANVAGAGKGGAAIAAYLHGRKIIDLWAGDARPGEDWKRDTVSVFYSATKVTPAVVAMLVHDRGELELDVPVARYWPEFAANGKEAVTVRQLLAMQSGLPYVPGYEGFLNSDGTGGWDQFEKIEQLMAESAPLTEIGTPVYAAFNFGALVNAVVRRASGRHLKDIWNDDIAGPLELDLWLGAPDQALARMATIYNDDELPPPPVPPGSLTAKSTHGTDTRPPVTEVLAELSSETSVFLRSGQASADLIGTAQGMARLYAMLVNEGSLDGVNFLSARTIAEFTTVQTTDIDLFYGMPSSWMLGGIEGNRETLPGKFLYGPGARSFGKGGAGGQNGFCDPDHGLSVGFLRSHLSNDFTFPLQSRLIDSIYACLKA
jgi:CubicO group peptidase (beta-lactamase class C family)